MVLCLICSTYGIVTLNESNILLTARKKEKKMKMEKNVSHNVNISRRVRSDTWRNPHSLFSRNEQELIINCTKSSWKWEFYKLLEMYAGEGQRCNEVH